MASALKVPHLRPHYPIQGLIRGLLSPSKASMLVSPAKIRPPKMGEVVGFHFESDESKVTVTGIPTVPKNPQKLRN